MLFFSSKRNRIVKKAVNKTVTEFSQRTPKLYKHLFYGAIDIKPQYLVVWYLFETYAELSEAYASGLCAELETTTINNLISLGYPKEAFDLTDFGAPKVSFFNGTEEEQNNIISSLRYGKANICLTTKEDINNKANGEYYMYFK